MLSLPEVMRPPQTFYKQLFANRVHAAAHAFRRDVWEKAGGFPGDIKLWGDWGFWLAATPHGDFVHVRRTIARYRINYRPGLALARMDQTLRDEVTVRLELIPRIAKQFAHVAHWKLRHASRRRFRHVLNHTLRDLAGADNARQAAILQPWAKSLGPMGLKLLGKFARNQPISLGWIDGFVVPLVREIYKRVQPARRGMSPEAAGLARDGGR